MADLSVMGFLNEETQQETEYNLKDAQARSDISTINGKIPSAASSNNKLVDTTAMNDAIGQAVSAAYKPAGNKTVAELTSSLLVAANRGKVYNMTDAGTTTADFVEGSGHPIRIGDDVGICEPTTGTFKFNILSGFIAVDTNPTQSSANPVSSGGVYSELAGMKNGQSIDSFGDVETALADKVDKVVGKGLSTNDYNNTAKGIVDNIQDNVKANTKLIKDTVGFSGKNLLPNNVVEDTYADVVLTRNANGSFTLNGGPASGNTASMVMATLTLPAGKYILSKSGRNDGYFQVANEAQTQELYYAGTSDALIELSVATTMVFRFRILQGATFSNEVFYPMLRDANILDPTYEPYFGSTAVAWADASKSVKKNLLIITATSRTLNNVAFTVNDDKSVTTGNTAASAQTWYAVVSNISLKKGSYKLTGCPSGGSISGGYNLAFKDETLNSITYDIGNGLNVNITDDNVSHKFSIFIRIDNGITANKTWYPMLRFASIADDTYEPYIPDNTELLPRSEQTMLGAKNINRTKYVSQTSSSVVWTANDDGSITAVSGTATGNNGEIGAGINDAFVAPFTAQVKIIGGLSSDIYLYPYDYTDSARPYKDARKTGRLTISDNQWGDTPLEFYMIKGHKYVIAGRVLINVTANNDTMYPRLLLASDTDTSFSAPVMTNKELTEMVAESVKEGDTNSLFRHGNMRVLSMRGGTMANAIALVADDLPSRSNNQRGVMFNYTTEKVIIGSINNSGLQFINTSPWGVISDTTNAVHGELVYFV